MEQPEKTLLILGTRGIPANHGGFETFAERYALYLAERGWNVSVYCQEEVEKVTQPVRTDMWRGVTRIFIQTARKGGLGDARLRLEMRARRAVAPRASVWCSATTARRSCRSLRMFGRKMFTNMDGIEWKRPKWSLPVRALVLRQRMDRRLDFAAARRRSSRDRRSSGDAPAAPRDRGHPLWRRSRVERAPAAPLRKLGLESRPLSDLDRAHRARQQHRDDGARVLRASRAA